MASSWMNNLRNLGRPSQPRPPSAPPSRGNASSPSGYSPSALVPPNIPPAPASPSLLATTTMQINDQAYQSNQASKKIPLFFREDYANFTVKGNFMTLAAKPQLIEEGEWIAHHVVEQRRVLENTVKIVQTEDRSTGRCICNEQTCPTMSAGSTVYTWIDTNRNTINLPAVTYIKHILTWVNGKSQDNALFPVDLLQTAPPLQNLQATNDPNHWLGKTSGFPQRFEGEVKNMFKQMFRCYAHLYWAHWLDFWNLGYHKELNTCFVHFVNVGRLYRLLNEKDIEPMQGLIDVWIRRGELPKAKENDGLTENIPALTSASASTTVVGSAS